MNYQPKQTITFYDCMPAFDGAIQFCIVLIILLCTFYQLFRFNFVSLPTALPCETRALAVIAAQPGQAVFSSTDID